MTRKPATDYCKILGNLAFALGIEDAERTTKVLQGAEGKRLTYRRVNKREAA